MPASGGGRIRRTRCVARRFPPPCCLSRLCTRRFSTLERDPVLCGLRQIAGLRICMRLTECGFLAKRTGDG